MTAQAMAGLVRFGALAAVLGGALRVASTLIPYTGESAGLEALYGVIDLSLLFGLIAVYIATAETTRTAGLAAFIVALAGIASIVGPDAAMFGIDFYRIGAMVFVAGLAALSVVMLWAGVMRIAGMLWIAAFASGLASAIFPQAFLVAGLTLGAGYIAAGFSLLRMRAALPQQGLSNG